jgi:D-alanyl-D-alanine carboxypeptidase
MGSRWGALVGLVVLVLAGLASASPSDQSALDAALRTARQRVGAPAAQAAIVACGQVAWAGADGVTDLRSKRRIDNATPFVIASTTKTVTATMVMQQLQAARASLSTPLARFYPKLPGATKITLRMLLSNRSGLPQYDSNRRITDIIDTQPRHRWTRGEILAVIRKLLFTPGSRFEYTNTNWIVLGGILEQLTRMPIETYFQRMIASPAGMTSSTFTRSQAILDRMAQPYTKLTDGSLAGTWVRGFGLPTYYWGPVFTDGGLVSTATDLARFGNALLRARLVTASTLAQMTDVGPDNYGLGIFEREFDGHRWLGHNGSYGGYESENFTDPARQVTITVIANMGYESDREPGVAEAIWNSVVKAYDRSRPVRCTRRGSATAASPPAPVRGSASLRPPD